MMDKTRRAIIRKEYDKTEDRIYTNVTIIAKNGLKKSFPAFWDTGATQSCVSSQLCSLLL